MIPVQTKPFLLPEGEGARRADEGHTNKTVDPVIFKTWAPHPSLRDTFSLREKGVLYIGDL